MRALALGGMLAVARVADGNGAGIRQDGENLIVRGSIRQGPRSENSYVLARREEGFTHEANKLFVSHNCLVDARSSGTSSCWRETLGR